MKYVLQKLECKGNLEYEPNDHLLHTNFDVALRQPQIDPLFDDSRMHMF